MGNRAVIAFDTNGTVEPYGIYLHWNGGIESIVAFLDYAEKAGVRTGDASYGAARLVQLIGNYFGGTTSIGIIGIDPAAPAESAQENGCFLVDCSGKTKGGQRILAILQDSDSVARGYDKARIDGKELKAMITKARKHAYWTTEKREESILGCIGKKNDSHFFDENGKHKM